MLQWYKSNVGVIFWQWVNQSFNALVNYTNRNANVEQDNTKLVIAYASATSSALVTALGLKAYLAKRVIGSEEKWNGTRSDRPGPQVRPSRARNSGVTDLSTDGPTHALRESIRDETERRSIYLLTP